MPKPKHPTERTDPIDEAVALRILADCFGHIGVKRDGGWEWVTDGRADPRNQRIKEMWMVQVTYQGKGWCWAHRTEKAAREMADWLKKNALVKNVRLWRGNITWEPA